MLKEIGRLLAAVLMGGFFMFTFHGVALPKDNGQWGNASPETRQWFKDQKSNNGVPCCDLGDGMKIALPDVKQDDRGRYLIRLDGKWFEVPPEAVINPKDRPSDLGMEAVAWIWNGKIQCFAPGGGI